jgi:N-acetyl-alpha-D-muramate 1-phosphate uridylyltransferase
MLPVAVLAGGLATRLESIAESIPKSLLVIAGRPFIFHQLELLKRQGVSRVVLCLGHLGDQVKGAVGDGREFGIAVDYSFDQEVLLGTGGAIRHALPKLGESFFVLYGDVYVRCSFAEVQAAYERSHCPALMTVLRNRDHWERSNVLFSNGRLHEYDKWSPRPEMEHIDYGVGVFSAPVFDRYRDRQVFDLADCYRELSLNGQLAGFEVEKSVLEIGSPQGIRDTEDFLTAHEGGT